MLSSSPVKARESADVFGFVSKTLSLESRHMIDTVARLDYSTFLLDSLVEDPF